MYYWRWQGVEDGTCKDETLSTAALSCRENLLDSFVINSICDVPDCEMASYAW